MKTTLYTPLYTRLGTVTLFGTGRKRDNKQSPEIDWFTLDVSQLDSSAVLR